MERPGRARSFYWNGESFHWNEKVTATIADFDLSSKLIKVGPNHPCVSLATADVDDAAVVPARCPGAAGRTLGTKSR